MKKELRLTRKAGDNQTLIIPKLGILFGSQAQAYYKYLHLSRCSFIFIAKVIWK